MDRRSFVVGIVVLLLCFVSACATQPENIVETVIVQITATSIPTVESTPTEVPTEIPTDVPTETQEQFDNTPACIPPNTEISLGVVTEIVDGDTIKVIIDGQTYTVRYIGIDTPETKDPNQPIQYMGPEATAKNLELVMGEVISLVKDVSETDQYDRLLRYVFVGDLSGTFVNHEMVHSGYAAVDTYPPDVACSEYFLEAQQEARENCLGLWECPTLTPIPLTPIPPTPIPPSPLPPVVTPAETNCHPSYPDVCLAINQGDYDCAGGSGNGPNYVRGPFKVLSPDPFGLDGDGDGIGCE